MNQQPVQLMVNNWLINITSNKAGSLGWVTFLEGLVRRFILNL